MSQSSLQIKITDLYNTTAKVYVSVCEKAIDFPANQKQIKGFIIDPKGKKEILIKIDNIPYGEYAITTFQDMDGDEKLTTGFFGAPKEPFGFSNNFKPRFKGPKWDDCKFIYSAEKNIQTIKLIKLF